MCRDRLIESYRLNVKYFFVTKSAGPVVIVLTVGGLVLKGGLGQENFFSFFFHRGGRPNPDLNESNTCARDDRRRRPKAATAAPEASHFALMPSVSRRSSRGGLVMATLALADD